MFSFLKTSTHFLSQESTNSPLSILHRSQTNSTEVSRKSSTGTVENPSISSLTARLQKKQSTQRQSIAKVPGEKLSMKNRWRSTEGSSLTVPLPHELLTEASPLITSRTSQPSAAIFPQNGGSFSENFILIKTGEPPSSPIQTTAPSNHLATRPQEHPIYQQAHKLGVDLLNISHTKNLYENQISSPGLRQNFDELWEDLWNKTDYLINTIKSNFDLKENYENDWKTSLDHLKDGWNHFLQKLFIPGTSTLLPLNSQARQYTKDDPIHQQLLKFVQKIDDTSEACKFMAFSSLAGLTEQARKETTISQAIASGQLKKLTEIKDTALAIQRQIYEVYEKQEIPCLIQETEWQTNLAKLQYDLTALIAHSEDIGLNPLFKAVTDLEITVNKEAGKRDQLARELRELNKRFDFLQNLIKILSENMVCDTHNLNEEKHKKQFDQLTSELAQLNTETKKLLRKQFED